MTHRISCILWLGVLIASIVPQATLAAQEAASPPSTEPASASQSPKSGTSATQPAQSAGPMRLRLKNGAFGVGRIVPSQSANTIGWQNEGFSQPFFFDTAAVRSISTIQAAPAQAAGDELFLVEAVDGQCVVGNLIKIDEQTLVVRSSILGEISIPAKDVTQLVRADYAGEVVYEGLANQAPWTPLGSVRDWDFRAGVLTAVKQAAATVGDLKLPSKCEISLSLAWKGVPDFVVSLGANSGEKSNGQVQATARLEIWNKSLVVVRETEKDADLVKLTELSEKNPQIELNILVDQESGLVVVRDMHGRLLGRVQVADKKQRLGSAIHIVNHGPSMSVERLEVRRWNGSSMLGSGKSRQVVLKSDKILGDSWISSFDNVSRQFVIEATDGTKSNVELSELMMAGLKNPPTPNETAVDKKDQTPSKDDSASKEPLKSESVTSDSSAGESAAIQPSDVSTPKPIEIILSDRSRVKGQWLAGSSNQLALRSTWASNDLVFAADQVVSWIGSDDRFSPDLTAHRNGVLKTADTEFAGFLEEDIDQPGVQTLRWQPHGSQNSSSILEAAEGSIAYRLQLPVSPSGQPTGRVDELLNQQKGESSAQNATVDSSSGAKSTREIIFVSGDTIDAYVERADEKGIYFLSDQTSVKFVEHARVDRLWLNSLTGSVKKTANEKLKRLMTVPRSMKDDPPTHLLISVTGDLLRGRLVQLDDKSLKFETRAEISEIPRDKIAEVVWLHERTWQAGAEVLPGTQPANNLGYRIHVVQQNRGLTFAPIRVAGAVLQGQSDLLGPCQIAIKQVSQILFGPNIDSRVAQFRENPWVLSLAQIPRAFMEDVEEDKDVLGVSSPLIGKPAPAFSMTKLDGGRVKLADFHGKPLVLDFWASWCGPCMKTLPAVSEAVASFDPAEVSFIAVNIQEADSRAQSAIEKLGLDVSVALDSDGDVATSYLATAIPQTVVIDAQGIVRFVFIGGKSNLAAELKDAIDKAKEKS